MTINLDLLTQTQSLFFFPIAADYGHFLGCERVHAKQLGKMVNSSALSPSLSSPSSAFEMSWCKFFHVGRLVRRSVRLLGRVVTVGAFSISAHMDLSSSLPDKHTYTVRTLVLRDQIVVMIRGMENKREREKERGEANRMRTCDCAAT